MDRRVGGQGDRCVLVVDRNNQFGEVTHTDGEFCTLLMPDGRESFCKKSEVSDGTMRAVVATKVIKADGTWMYFADSTNPENRTKTAWYTKDGVHA